MTDNDVHPAEKRLEKTIMKRFLFSVAVISIPSLLVAADRAEWTQWRGPDRLCAVPAGTEWPEKLDEATLVETYRVPLEPSYSGPIVAQDRIFVTETVNKEKEVVRAGTAHRRSGPRH